MRSVASKAWRLPRESSKAHARGMRWPRAFGFGLSMPDRQFVCYRNESQAVTAAVTALCGIRDKLMLRVAGYTSQQVCVGLGKAVNCAV